MNTTIGTHDTKKRTGPFNERHNADMTGDKHEFDGASGADDEKAEPIGCEFVLAGIHLRLIIF